MHSSMEPIRSRAFTDDLSPYMEEAKTMYPGGRFQKFLRGFHTIFHRGLVEFTDEFNAMVLLDRAQRAGTASMDEAVAPVARLEPNFFQPDFSDILPAGGIIE